MFGKSKEKFDTVKLDFVWNHYRSTPYSSTDDITIKRNLIDGYMVTERVPGYVKIRIFWNHDPIDAWVPESYLA